MNTWFPIETERLLLREFAESDFADVHEYSQDPLVSRYDSWGPNTPDITRNYVARMVQQHQWPRSEINLAAELKAERKVIGSLRIWIVDEEHRTAEIGYTFNRAYWNRGFATEAAAALLERAFGAMNLHRVCATCDTRNGASWRVMEKLGMRREGHFLENKFQKGEWRDSYRYALLAEERSPRLRSGFFDTSE